MILRRQNAFSRAQSGDRGIKYQFIDMKEKGMSKGGFKYIAAEDKLEKILENPQVIKTPMVRNGKQPTVGIYA